MNKRSVSIIVNAQPHEWNEEKISFEEVVKIAFPNIPHNEVLFYTVTYDNGPKQNPKGTLSKKDKVHVQDKMFFTCTRTEQS